MDRWQGRRGKKFAKRANNQAKPKKNRNKTQKSNDIKKQRPTARGETKTRSRNMNKSRNWAQRSETIK